MITNNPIIKDDSIDLSFIGKDGLIIQYEDIVSLVGFNVIRYIRSKNISNEISKMSISDILLSYFNRESEDISKWLSDEFNIENFNISDYNNSINTYSPNLLYSYKVFMNAYQNGIKNLMIYSNEHSSIIEKFIKFYDVPIKYVYGDIINTINDNPNCTYITSSPSNINKCLNTGVPFALTIVDDFMYVSPLLVDGSIDSLRDKNIFVQFTSILSGGFINENA